MELRQSSSRGVDDRPERCAKNVSPPSCDAGNAYHSVSISIRRTVFVKHADRLRRRVRTNVSSKSVVRGARVTSERTKALHRHPAAVEMARNNRSDVLEFDARSSTNTRSLTLYR